MDSLISLTSGSVKAEIKNIHEFVAAFLQLLIEWMRLAPSCFHMQDIARDIPNLFMVDWKTAFLAASEELFDTVSKLFGMNTRCNAGTFFTTFDDFLSQGEAKYVQPRPRGNMSGQVLSFFNDFGNMGGFQELLNFVTSQKKGEAGIPLDLVSTSLAPLHRCLENAQPQFSQEIGLKVQQAIMQRFENISEKEIKDLNQKTNQKLVGLLKKFC